MSEQWRWLVRDVACCRCDEDNWFLDAGASSFIFVTSPDFVAMKLHPSLDCTGRPSAVKLGYEDYRTVTRNHRGPCDAMGTKISN
jgi:hypothetical protein